MAVDGLHIIAERDVGLFSLVQQVIGNVPWALAEGRVPVVDFGRRTSYWTPRGFRNRTSVWEYYFEPLDRTRPAVSIPDEARASLTWEPPAADDVGYRMARGTFISAHFGDHPEFSGGRCRSHTSGRTRTTTCVGMPRGSSTATFTHGRHCRVASARFAATHLAGAPLIGVHARGTDAISEQELRPHRRGSLVLARYVDELHRLLEEMPTARIFVASDDERSIQHLRQAFLDRVIAWASVRHHGGAGAGHGPTGWLMPAYIAGNRDLAARNGEDAVIEYLLLSRCDYLVHNGSSLARTVLLNAPHLPHTNTHTMFRS